MRFTLGLLCSLFLAGCVTHVDKQWVNRFEYDRNVEKPRWTVEQLHRDQQVCQKSAYYLARGAFFIDMKQYESVYRECMEGERGWRVEGEEGKGDSGMGTQ